MKGYLLYNCLIVTGEYENRGIILTEGERIRDIWLCDGDDNIVYGDETIQSWLFPNRFSEANPDYVLMNLEGHVVMAGGIDAHVHFREPGMTHKADIRSESAAALAGGITSFFDMPNTNPPTISAARLSEKLGLAENSSHCNYGFHIGATNENAEELQKTVEGTEGTVSGKDFGGIKVFMGSSTGNMLVDDSASLEKIFSLKGKAVLVHCEDENIIRANMKKAEEEFGDCIPFREHENIRSRSACIKSTIKATELAIRNGTRLHVLHISTMEEAEMVRAAKIHNPQITSETSVNYLWFCDKDYDRLGSRCKCNPSIKTEEDRTALRKALKDGLIDTIGSDHAPHLAEEKDRSYMLAPSGMPSIQHELPVLFTIASEEGIGFSRIAKVISENPATILGVVDRGFIKKGYFADLVVIDPEVEFTVDGNSLKYKCGWSPYTGCRLRGKIEKVFLNGTAVVEGGELLFPDSPMGKQLEMQTR